MLTKIGAGGKKEEVKLKNINIDVDKEEHETDLSIVETIKCWVPDSIVRVMKGLNKLYDDVEYSILGKMTWNQEKERYEVAEEYYIPKQEVTSAHIDYEPGDDDLQYNLVIHKHPNGCKRFSGTDERYINVNFEGSLLWVNGGFEYGIVNVKMPGMGIRLRANLDVEVEEDFIIPQDHEDKITKKQSRRTKEKDDDKYVSSFYRDWSRDNGYSGGHSPWVPGGGRKSWQSQDDLFEETIGNESNYRYSDSRTSSLFDDDEDSSIMETKEDDSDSRFHTGSDEEDNKKKRKIVLTDEDMDDIASEFFRRGSNTRTNGKSSKESADDHEDGNQTFNRRGSSGKDYKGKRRIHTIPLKEDFGKTSKDDFENMEEDLVVDSILDSMEKRRKKFAIK